MSALGVVAGARPSKGAAQHTIAHTENTHTHTTTPHTPAQVLTGARIPATEAAKIGLISRVVPKDQLLEEAMQVGG